MNLQLYAQRADLLQPRFVDVHLVHGEWTEIGLTFANAPRWELTPIATAVVLRPNYWYSWDVTETVFKERKAPSLAFVVLLREMAEGREEQVVFNSREAKENHPRLVVTYIPAGLSPFWLYPLFGATLIVVAALAFLLGRHLRR